MKGSAINIGDIGKYVLIDGKRGKEGYFLLGVKYMSGNVKLLAEVLDVYSNATCLYDLEDVSSYPEQPPSSFSNFVVQYFGVTP